MSEHAMPTPVLDALNKSIAAARHLTDMDAGAVEAARALALKIDAADEYLSALADYAVDKNLRPPSQDNVSPSALLKYCESLGLTPAGREKLTVKQGAKLEGTLGRLQAIAGGKA